MKPTDRRVSLAGHILEIPGLPKCIRQMLVPGPLARSVEDLRLCFSLIAGVDPRQPDIPPVPVDDPLLKPLNQLRIAWSDNCRVPIAAEIQAVIHKAINKIAQSGANIEQWTPSNLDWTAAQTLYYKMAAYNYRYAQPPTLNAVKKHLPFSGEKQLKEKSRYEDWAILFKLSKNCLRQHCRVILKH